MCKSKNQFGCEAQVHANQTQRGRWRSYAAALIGRCFTCLLVASAAIDSGTAFAADFEAAGLVAPHFFNPNNELAQPEDGSGALGQAWLYGVRIGAYPWSSLGLELEGAAGSGTLSSVWNGKHPVTLAALRAHAIGRLALGPVGLSALAGGGWMRTTAPAHVTFGSDTDPYGYAGLALDMRIAGRLIVRADGRYHLTASSEFGNPLASEVSAALSLGWRFVPTPAAAWTPPRPVGDEDGDGVHDDADQCPLEAESRNGVRDDDGCPEDRDIAKRVHQTRYVALGEAQIGVLARQLRADRLAAAATPSDDPQAPPEPLAEHTLPPLVGPGDDDRDGLERKDDACPDAAEDSDGFEDSDGCPDVDDDGDGLNDDVDECPREAELVNGVRDGDGCPEDPAEVRRYHQTRYGAVAGDAIALLPDDASRIADHLPSPRPLPREREMTVEPAAQPLAPRALPPLVGSGDDDRDGLVRADDVCPDRAEDTDGFEDSDGCPELDDDDDAVADAADKCPREGETHNGYDDDDGCPDGVPAPLAERVGVLQGLEFAKNSATLLPKSSAVLQTVVEVLVKYPQARVEIAGHTDNAGKRDKNIDLSQRRAESVRAWLVAKGADGKRMTAKGYGPDKPTASNKSGAGRAKNRRVEFNLVVREPGA